MTQRGPGGKFLPGIRPEGAGRPAGTPNKRSLEFQQTLLKHNFNPAEALLELLGKAQQGLEYGSREEKPVYLRIATDLVKEIASYTYPKLKAVERRNAEPSNLTPEQRLEMMKAATQALENDINRHGSSLGDSPGDVKQSED